MNKGIPFQAFLLTLLALFAANLCGAQNATTSDSGSFQKLSLDFDALSDFGSGAQGFGSAASLSYSLRGPRGSLGLSVRYLSVPKSMTDMPSGNFGSARVGYAALLVPGISVGAGLSGAIGDNGGLGWNIAADLGVEGFAGDLGFLKEIAWGLSVSGLGVSGGVPLPATRIHRSLPRVGVDPWPSAKIGIHALILRQERFRLGLGLGLVSPGFEDIGFFSSLDLGFDDILKLRAGWDIGWKDIASGSTRSLLPSLGIVASLPLGRVAGGSAAGVAAGVGFEPLYGNVSAISGALAYSWGSTVAIEPASPTRNSPMFLSPNGDGVQDSLSIPLNVKAPGNIGAFQFSVREKATGRVVFEESLVRNDPDSLQRMRADGDTAALVHAGIVPPQVLLWDGKLSDGRDAPDGEYVAGYIYRDIGGAWQRRHRDLLTLIVDRAAPGMKLAFAGDRVFSPDGDGRKDTIALRVTGTDESSWNLDIFDSAGKSVFSREWSNSIPSDIVWSGKDLRGAALPDGLYSARISGRDAAGNAATGNLEGIKIDTRSPKAKLSVDSQAFSPNGDGRKDKLGIIPWIESYVQLSNFSIVVLDAAGGPVWSTQDRGWLETGTPFSFDGMSVGGRPLPEGFYHASMNLEYGNGYMVPISSPIFEIDTRPPVASLILPDQTSVFSPDGDGRRDSIALSIAATGGKDWNLRVLDASGAGITSRGYRGAPPSTYIWDGKTGTGSIAPEGEYRFELSGADEAGNVASVQSATFLLDNSRPSATVGLDAEVFSPDGDGILETIAVTPRIAPNARPSGWILTVRNASGIEVHRQEDPKGENLPEKFLLDGKIPTTKKTWPDGRYQAIFAFAMRNGYSGEAQSQWFRLDTAAPDASIQADRQFISPGAPGAASRVRIAQTGTATDSWKGELSGPDDSPARSWDFDSRLPAVIEWDGKDAAGRKFPDGAYSYRLRGVDDAGHSFVSKAIQIVVDTESKSVTLAVEPTIFSPDGDGKGDTANFGITTTSRTKSSSYSLDIYLRSQPPAAARVSPRPMRVRGFSGRSDVPKSISWDGLADSGAKAPNGTYSATCVVSYPNGDQCESAPVEFSLDTNKPKVFVKADASAISPNGDGFMDELGFTLIADRNSAIASWNFSIVSVDQSAKIFFTKSGGDIPGRLVWDGRDESGSAVLGQVFGKLTVTYVKGDIAEASSETVIAEEPLPKLEVAVMPDFFSPDGDGIKDMATFLVTVDEPSQILSWRLEVLETAAGEGLAESGETRERVFQVWSGSGAPPVSITWDGRSQTGEKVQAACDYPFRMRVKDRKGNQILVKGIIVVDVLVVREGSRIRINIPSIEFRASVGDFAGLSPQSEAKNQKVISRLVQILARFPDFRIRIEGYANNEAKMNGLSADKVEAEEKSETVPLSLSRASFIRDILVYRGFDSRRFSVAGLGSSLPAADPKDPVARWKNRRVEFILVKEP